MRDLRKNVLVFDSIDEFICDKEVISNYVDESILECQTQIAEVLEGLTS